MAPGPIRLPARLRSAVVRPGPDPEYADGDDASWQVIDWEAMTRRVTVHGQELHLVDTGGEDKPVLLLLHGLSNRWQHWLLTIPALMAGHRCIAPDLPGFGESPLGDEEISIRGYARLLDGLCQALGVGRAAVVGSSMGGFVGVELALSFPTRIDCLVLVSAAGLSIQSVPRLPLLGAAHGIALLGSRVVPLYEALIGHPQARRLLLGLGLRYPERLSVPLTRELVRGFGRPGFLPAMRALTSYSVRDRLAEITIPALVVWGESDLLVPVADAAEFERLLGGPTEVVIMADTGHSPMLERPSRFNRLLAAFLAEPGAPGPQVAGTR